MSSTLVGYFDSYDEAKRTQEDLLGSGFGETDVEILAGEPAAPEQQRTEPSGFWENMKAKFGFADPKEQQYYQEAARHGGTIVTVRTPDDKVDLAAEIIERHHPADLDQRMEEWGGTRAAEPMEGESIPVVEEQLRMGKQVVRRGGVRIHQFVSETPVEQDIQLREEQIRVERQPADRPLGTTEGAFQERSYEVEAMGEEPVIAKEARVVEDVKIGKQVTEREERVRDTVRKTEVEVEEEEPGKRRE